MRLYNTYGDNGFAAAQRAYDAQVPDWVDAPDVKDNWAKFRLSGSVILNTRNMEILEALDAYDVEVIGDDGPDCVYMGFTLTDDGDYDDVMKSYRHFHKVLDDIIEYWDDDEFESEYIEHDDSDDAYDRWRDEQD